MRRGAAPDLALVLAAEEAGRARGAALLEQSRKLRRFYRRVAAGKVKPPKPRLSYEERAELRKEAQRRRLAAIAERNHQADTPIPVAWRDAAELQTFLDECYDWAETKAAREVKHAKVRELIAERFDQLAAWAEQHGLLEAAAEYRIKIADKLRGARRVGWWAFCKVTRKRYMRFRDRSGLVRLDPSESRRDTARLIMRYVPTVLAALERGEHVITGVWSMPNVPRDRLAWGKAELFRETARFFRNFPEFTGRLEIQEDPLAIDGQSWNVHNNVIALVNPKKVTRLPPDLVRQGEIPLPGQLAKLPTPIARDRAPPGELSYARVHHFWQGRQVQLRKLEGGNAETVAKAFKESLKYTVKLVTKKQLDAQLAAGLDQPGTDPRVSAHGDAGGAGVSRLGDAHAPKAGALPFADARAGDRRCRAPALTEWPLDALHEWHQANKGKRRVRSFGCFYNAPKPERPEDPELDGKLRFGGRVTVSPQGFRVEAARVHYLDLTHGDKFGRDFPVAPCRSPGALARAGPIGLPLAS